MRKLITAFSAAAIAACLAIGVSAQPSGDVPPTSKGFELIQQGIQIYKENAENGDARSAFIVGSLYYSGIFVQQDVALAMEYFAQAAEAGDPEGLYYMAMHYHHGYSDVAIDKDRALEMYQLAADAGHDGAAAAIVELQQ